MKDYNEMAASVLLRAAEYEAERKKNQRRAATAACCLCLAAVAGFGVWRGGALRNDVFPAAQFASEAEAAARGGEELVDLNSGGLDGDPYGYSAGKAPDWGYSDPLHEDVPVQGSYLESPGGEATADNAFYGGVYMDRQGVTHVLLTEDTPENRAAVRSILPLPDEAVVFDTVTYRLAYLEILQEKVTQGMIDRTLPFVTASAVDERGNCVRVTVATDDEAALAKLRACDPLGGALAIERGAATAQEDLPANDARRLPASEVPGDAEPIPTTEGHPSGARSIVP